MDYGRVLSRAWQITWRYKVLWILGFLVALGSGSGGAGSGYRFGANDFRNFNNFPSLQPLQNLTGWLVVLGCLALIVALVVFVLSLIAEGGLIAGVIQAEDGETVSLSSAWRAGGARFWTLLGIWALTTFLPLVLLIGLGIIGVVAGLGAAGGAALLRPNGNPGALAGGGVAILIACCCTGICGLVIVTLVLQQIRLYAERAAMLEGRGAVAAFERGWQVLRQRFGPTLMLWLIFLLIGLVLAAVIIVVLLVVLLPFVIASGRGQVPNLLVLPVIATALVGIIVAAIIGSVVQVFISASWTLAYRELTGAAPAGPLTPGPWAPSAPWSATPLPPSEVAPIDVPPAGLTPPEPPLEVPPEDLPPQEPPRV
jgi:hypothetical protein